MCIFMSEQMPWFHWKKNEWPPNSPVQNPLDYNDCDDGINY